MTQQDTFPSEIFDIIQEIANLSIEGNFLFRGEPKHHSKISSTLYRECESIIKKANLVAELSDFNIENIESEIPNQVRALRRATKTDSKHIMEVYCEKPETE